MRTKIILAILIGLLLGNAAVTFPTVVCTSLGTLTPSLSLCKPATGEVGWDAALNNNFQVIDGQLGPTATPQLSSLGLGASAGTAGSLKMTGKLLLYNNAAPTDGQLLIGGTSAGNYTPATLTAGTGITITNGNNAVTITGLAGIFAGEFVSTDQTIPGSQGVITLAHGLGAKPKLIQVTLKNATGELGYSTGDEVPVGYTLSGSTGISWAADATNVTITVGTVSIAVLNKSTGAGAAITNGNWKFVARAWK